MKPSKQELKFWKQHYHISSAKDIPTRMEKVTAIDSDMDDEHVHYLTQRIGEILSFDIENAEITDKAIESISTMTSVQSISLIHCKGITKNALNFINTMQQLQKLVLIKTNIELQDALQLKNTSSLQELHISCEEEREEVEDLINEIETNIKGCKVFLNYEGF